MIKEDIKQNIELLNKLTVLLNTQIEGVNRITSTIMPLISRISSQVEGLETKTDLEKPKVNAETKPKKRQALGNSSVQEVQALLDSIDNIGKKRDTKEKKSEVKENLDKQLSFSEVDTHRIKDAVDDSKEAFILGKASDILNSGVTLSRMEKIEGILDILDHSGSFQDAVNNLVNIVMPKEIYPQALGLSAKVSKLPIYEYQNLKNVLKSSEKAYVNSGIYLNHALHEKAGLVAGEILLRSPRVVSQSEGVQVEGYDAVRIKFELNPSTDEVKNEIKYLFLPLDTRLNIEVKPIEDFTSLRHITPLILYVSDVI